MAKLRWALTYVSFLRILFPWIFLHTCRFSGKCGRDLDAWIRNNPQLEGHARFWQFGYLLIHFRECRNILLNRLHRNVLMYVITRLLFKPLESCYISMPPEKIGGGFYLQHGFATIIAAKEIGEDCKIFQQVTIGCRGEDAPVLGDRVMVTAGAIVIGNVHVGEDTRIGAGSVVTRDVPAGATVAGVPARETRLISGR